MVAAQRLGHPYLGLMGPAEGAAAITTSDSAELTYVTRAIYVGTAGDLHVVMDDGSEVTFSGMAGGVIYPLRVRQVFTDSTATDLVGLY